MRQTFTAAAGAPHGGHVVIKDQLIYTDSGQRSHSSGCIGGNDGHLAEPLTSTAVALAVQLIDGGSDVTIADSLALIASLT